MPQVVVNIAGRSYRMACGEGQEAHLQAVADRLDGKITSLKTEFGEIGDQRITVMAALTMADDLTEAERRIAELETQVAVLTERENSQDDRVAALGESVAAALDEVTAGLDGMSRTILGGLR
jgi:cell division protein ZapA